ncbi:MAG: cell wall hydrolase [Sphingomonadaceae bacterium]|uniref:cell wall hydrolase n=1 Tax=Thermaurantiacus sp. TaxID=2820283 RepID=UPI00298F3887|nr:cell wall hydrolase [Thermaurantiacus sp.]MCS6987660.1 cell wall hydrolase [Sphingomonadaceae bacterium]MDW8415261.1 cell wall hydrolase [Thermaurantiacus sp.]
MAVLIAARAAPVDDDQPPFLVAPTHAPATQSIEESRDPTASDPETAPRSFGEAPATLASLVAEVRHHAMATFGPDGECLARAVYWEAKGEPLEGQLAVAEVILNRVERGRFGRSVCEVVTAPGQFSFVERGRIPEPQDRRRFAQARAIAWIALAEAWPSVVGEATHFHALHVNPGWRLTRVARIGNHVFYR